MFDRKNFGIERWFANNKDDLRINEMQYSVELSVRVINGSEGFRFYIFYCLKTWQNFEMEVCLLMGRGGGNIRKQIPLRNLSYLSTVP